MQDPEATALVLTKEQRAALLKLLARHEEILDSAKAFDRNRWLRNSIRETTRWLLPLLIWLGTIIGAALAVSRETVKQWLLK